MSVMSRGARFWLLFIVFAGLLFVREASATGYVEALKIANDSLIFMGEGYGSTQQLNLRLTRLQEIASVEGVGQESLKSLHKQLVETVAKTGEEGEIPWLAASGIARSIRGVVVAAEQAGSTEPGLPIEFLISQYLYRAFFGTFELAPEAQESLISKNEKDLLVQVKASVLEPLEPRKKVALSCVERAVLNLDADAKSVSITPLVFFSCARRLSQ